MVDLSSFHMIVGFIYKTHMQSPSLYEKMVQYIGYVEYFHHKYIIIGTLQNGLNGSRQIYFEIKVFFSKEILKYIWVWWAVFYGGVGFWLWVWQFVGLWWQRGVGVVTQLFDMPNAKLFRIVDASALIKVQNQLLFNYITSKRAFILVVLTNLAFNN